MPKKQGQSLNRIAFKDEVTRIMRTLYSSLTLMKISEEYLSMKLIGSQSVLNIYPHAFPYNYYDVNLETVKKDIADNTSILFSRTIVDLIMNFENYFYNAIKRFYVINPEKIKDEDAQFQFKDLYGYINGEHYLVGIANALVDKKLRNKKTTEMINVFDAMVDAGYKVKVYSTEKFKKAHADIEEMALVRNAVVHNEGRVTMDLIKFNSGKYLKLNDRIRLDNRSCVNLHRSMFLIIDYLDSQFCVNTVKDNDVVGIISELFLQYGYEDKSTIRQIVNDITRTKFDDTLVYQVISETKKGVTNPKIIQNQELCNRILLNYFA